MLHPKALCQLELHTQQLAASLDFFAGVLGWKRVPITLHDHVVMAVPDDSSFGISLIAVEAQQRKQAAAVIPYFRWEDSLEALIERVRINGGRLVSGPRAVPAYGLACIIEEPGGIQIGFFQPAESIPS